MKEKKVIKISFTQAIIIILVVLAIIFGTIFFIYYRNIPHSIITTETGATSTTTTYQDTEYKIPTKSNTEYTVLSTYFKREVAEPENFFVTSNEELKTYLLQYLYNQSSESSTKLQEQDETHLLNEITVDEQPVLTYFNDSFFENNNLAIQIYFGASYYHSTVSVVKENTNGVINIIKNTGGPFAPLTDIKFVILDKSITHVDYNIYTTTVRDNICEPNYVVLFSVGFVITVVVIAIVSMLTIRHNRKVEDKDKVKNRSKRWFMNIIIGILILIIIFGVVVFIEALTPTSIINHKPIIYLYPTEEEKVSVKLLYDDMVTASYPKYTTGWNVLAKEDGTLIDLSTNRSLYSLYYESNNTIDFKVENDGFVVKGEDVSKFLEEKLDILGLTEREAEEFIIYWLPKLEANKYNYIRFATLDEINANMPLEINPNPDTVIRVLMTFKALDNPIEVKEQELITPERKGFVAVEWGGTEIK